MPAETPTFTMDQLFSSFAAASDGRAAQILELEPGELTPEELCFFHQLETTAKPGSRIPYIDFTTQPVFPAQSGCQTQGREIWDAESGKDGKWKMSIKHEASALKCMAIVEALAKLRAATQHPENDAAQQLLAKDESNISTQYSKLTALACGKKADGNLHFGCNKQSVMWYLPESDGIQPVPPQQWENERLESLGEGIWFPFCKWEKLDSGKYQVSGKWFEVTVSVRLGIAQSGKISWNLSSVLFHKETVGMTGRVHHAPIDTATMANATWTSGTELQKGKLHSNTYFNMTHSAGSNPKYSANMVLCTYDAEGHPEPLDVEQVWVSKDHPDTEATVVLASKSDPQLDLISKMQVNIEAEVEKNLKTYGKTWRPNKKKPELTWKSALEFHTPTIGQNQANMEKFGERKNKWLKLPYHFDKDDNKSAEPVRTYKLQTTFSSPELLITSDPEKLVADGILKRCSPGLHVGKNAKVFPVVCISKVTTSPKFSYGFGAEYLIVVDVVNVPLVLRQRLCWPMAQCSTQ